MRENKEAHVRERGQGRSDAFKEQCLSHVLKWGPLWKEKEWGIRQRGKAYARSLRQGSAHHVPGTREKSSKIEQAHGDEEREKVRLEQHQGA